MSDVSRVTVLKSFSFFRSRPVSQSVRVQVEHTSHGTWAGAEEPRERWCKMMSKLAVPELSKSLLAQTLCGLEHTHPRHPLDIVGRQEAEVLATRVEQVVGAHRLQPQGPALQTGIGHHIRSQAAVSIKLPSTKYGYEVEHTTRRVWGGRRRTYVTVQKNVEETVPANRPWPRRRRATAGMCA